jgi:CRISPR-associated protein (TIGR02584 family)
MKKPAPRVRAPLAAPQSLPETVLLAVTGMSPAILTETVWALAHEHPPTVPSRVIVVTTSEGRRQIDQLFQPVPRFHSRSPWDALRSALTAAGHDLAGRLRFGTTADDVRVITAPDPAAGRSRELADLRTPADNEAAADFLLEQVRTIVENPDTRLVVSIAGGRKTMGALLYACLTLAGRETDRLTHVLVNEPFETLREFYFPAQPGGALATPTGQSCDPASASPELADVTFVPLRNLFVRELGRPAGTFSRLVQSCRENIRRRATEALRLAVDSARCEIEVNGQALKLAPREHIVLLFLATRAKQGGERILSYREALEPLNKFLDKLRDSAPPHRLGDWRHGDALRNHFHEDQEIRRALSSLGRKVARLSHDGAALADALPEKGRFTLELPSPLIHLK